jgi:hypothetical protein
MLVNTKADVCAAVGCPELIQKFILIKVTKCYDLRSRAMMLHLKLVISIVVECSDCVYTRKMTLI